MKKVEKALVVGAGIGGLTAAVALRLAGIDVDIVEREAEVHVYGVGIIQPSNALRALDAIGLGKACVASEGGFPGWAVHDGMGHLHIEVPNRNVASEGYPAINGITRPALHHILTKGARDAGANIQLGSSISAIEEKSDCVSVKLADGTARDYDVVVAADGCNSSTRALIGIPGKPQPNGQMVFRYNFARPKDMVWGGIYYGKKSKVGLVPMSRDTMYMFLVVAVPSGDKRIEDAELANAMRAHLEEYGGLVAKLKGELTDPKGVVLRHMEQYLAPLPWHRGRVIIIGDAAHTTTPHLAQGASMAIEDAVLLADYLKDATDLNAALTAFGERRFPRAKLVVDASLEIGRLELLEFKGDPDPTGNPGMLLGKATEAMMAPI